MSGDFQHYIPQHFLTAFKASVPGREKRVWIYRKDAGPSLEPVKDIAGDTHFYSPPAPSEVDTLDNRITKYENRLATLTRWLRKQPLGPLSDSAGPAEVVAHLTTRTASVRGSLATGAKQLILQAFGLFQEPEGVRRLLKLDGDELSPDFRQKLIENIRSDPRFEGLQLSDEALGRLLLGLARENFSRIHAEGSPLVSLALAQIHEQADSLVGESHKKALLKSVVPEPRLEPLRKLAWRIEASDGNAVLPDCVAIGIDTQGTVAPLTLSDLGDLAAVVMPLKPGRLLIGAASGAAPYDPVLFNLHAISCSESFFASASSTPELAEWSKYIGVRMQDVLRCGLAEVFKPYAPIGKAASAVDAAQEGSSDQQSALPLNFTMHFLGCGDEEIAQRIAGTVRGIIEEVYLDISLARLDGITFAANYADALRQLDRGFSASKPLATTQEENVEGVAMAPLVVRDGVIKAHIVMRADWGLALISENADARAFAVQLLIGELAEVGCVELFDTALPGIFLKPIADLFDGQRFTRVERTWSAYFSARVAAPYAPAKDAILRDLLLAALKRAQETIPRLRLEYRFHGNLDALLDGVLTHVGYVLHHAAAFVGHLDGLASPDDANAPIDIDLAPFGLGPWLVFFRGDLRRLWERRGLWTSIDEFLLLNLHVERLLWPYGIMLSRTSDGLCRVEVPMASDLRRLPVETLKRPLWLLRGLGRCLWRFVQR